jgi:uncharacterized membrane protein
MDSARAIAAAFLATLVVFVVVDAAWLMLVAMKMFQRQLGAILRPEPVFGAAIAFYLIYTAGLVVLAIRPALAARSLTVAATHGAVLGLTAYATFDLTNLAVIRGWTIELAAFDIAWGVVASACASMAGYAASVRVAVSLRAGKEVADR